MTKKYPFVYGAIGVHPNEVDELNEGGIAWLKENSVLPKIVAVGEIGLDYYWDEPGQEVQKKWFLRQLELAREVKLPVVIHSRDAAERYAGYYEVISCRESRQSDSLLLLYEGDGAGIFKYGFLSGNRRSRNLQKRQKS